LSPLFNGTPDRWFRRKTSQPRAIVAVELNDGRNDGTHTANEPSRAVLPVDATLHELASAASAACAQGALLHLLWHRTIPEGEDWKWEAIGLMELFPDTVMVGGRICGSGTVLAAGSYFGFGRGCDSPDRGRAIGDPGYFAQMWKQHSVSAVSSQHAMIDPRFLLEFIERMPAARVSLPYLGAWLGAYARRTARRVIYTPFMTATCDGDFDALVSDEERAAFVALNGDVIPEKRLLSAHLGLTPQTAYQPVDSAARNRHLADLERQARERKT
jgi:O-antigen biosynthesis protein